MCSACSLMPPAQDCTWDTRKTTSPPMSSPISGACRGITSCTPWDGMPSGYPPNAPRSGKIYTPPLSRGGTPIPSASRYNASAYLTTGRAKSIPQHPTTTNGRSGCSSASMKKDWHTSPMSLSIGAPLSAPSSPTKKSKTESMSTPATRLNAASCASGCLKSPPTPNVSSKTSGNSTGPTASRKCNATGLASLKAQRFNSV